MRLCAREGGRIGEREGPEVVRDVTSCQWGWQRRHRAGETQHGEPRLDGGTSEAREVAATPEVTLAKGGLPGMPQATGP